MTTVRMQEVKKGARCQPPSRHPARKDQPMPPTRSKTPNIAAAERLTRPEGIGRKGRSRLSCSKSNTSFHTMPPQYKHPDAAKRHSAFPIHALSKASGFNCQVAKTPTTMSAKAVKTFGKRTS